MRSNKMSGMAIIGTALCISLCSAQDQVSATGKVVQVEVVGERLKEYAPVGPAKQPEWTTARRFPTTRVYLQKTPGEIGFEQWWRMQRLPNGDTVHRLQEEIEFGLPWRMQLDLYYTWKIDAEGESHYDSIAPELRYALADWDVIPLNPTIYLEWKFTDSGADVCEAKLLLGDDLPWGLRWGMNLVWEQQLGDERERELAVSQALGYTLLDQKLNIGVEMKYLEVTASDNRGDPENEWLLGPSLQWRPTANIHVDVVPLFGLNNEAPDVEMYVVAGFNINKFKGEKKILEPVSLKSQ